MPGHHKKIVLSACIICLLLLNPGYQSIAQEKSNFSFKRVWQKELTSRFSLVNNLLILPLRINKSSELFFITDTGINASIITELNANDSLSLETGERIRIKGLGSGEPMYAYLSENNRISIQDSYREDISIHGDSLRVLLLMEDLFHLSKHLGTQVNGLIGAELFAQFIVEINYNNQQISFTKPARFNRKKLKRYQKIPLQIINNKPFVNLEIIQENGEKVPVRLLIDSGASFGLLLAKNSDPKIKLPSTTVKAYLGQGLSGSITGLNGRIKALNFGKYELKGPIVSYPDSVSVQTILKQKHRNGSLGSEVLRRFNLIFDYLDSALYLKPNRSYRDAFSYNKSGIELETPYPGLPIYTIYSVLKGSPADLAGFKPGDQILKINFQKTDFMTLDEIYRVFQGRSGKKIRLTVQRNSLEYRKQFKLEKTL